MTPRIFAQAEHLQISSSYQNATAAPDAASTSASRLRLPTHPYGFIQGLGSLLGNYRRHAPRSFGRDQIPDVAFGRGRTRRTRVHQRPRLRAKAASANQEIGKAS